MTYYNLIFRYGEEKFASDAVAAGLDGLILPDLPVEEAGSMSAAAKKAGFASADAVGVYMRSLISTHHDSLGAILTLMR